MVSTDHRSTISAILIVYNEEKTIERCLRSLAGVVDEIIVIHDGDCSDNTLSIAKKYTDKIYIEPHYGEAEPHQIQALQYSSCPWILKIDADEFLSEELRQNLRALINNDKYSAYAFLWPIWNGSRYLSRDVPYKEALFRKEKIYAVNFPHKTFSFNGPMKLVPLLLEHQPKYNNYTLNTFRRKWIPWIKVQAVRTIGHNDARFFNATPEQVQAFHETMEKQIRYAHPLLSPGWFLLSFSKFFLRLKIWKNPQLIHVAFLQGLYAAWLCYGLWEEKRLTR